MEVPEALLGSPDPGGASDQHDGPALLLLRDGTDPGAPRPARGYPSILTGASFVAASGLLWAAVVVLVGQGDAWRDHQGELVSGAAFCLAELVLAALCAFIALALWQLDGCVWLYLAVGAGLILLATTSAPTVVRALGAFAGLAGLSSRDTGIALSLLVAGIVVVVWCVAWLPVDGARQMRGRRLVWPSAIVLGASALSFATSISAIADALVASCAAAICGAAAVVSWWPRPEEPPAASAAGWGLGLLAESNLASVAVGREHISGLMLAGAGGSLGLAVLLAALWSRLASRQREHAEAAAAGEGARRQLVVLRQELERQDLDRSEQRHELRTAIQLVANGLDLLERCVSGDAGDGRGRQALGYLRHGLAAVAAVADDTSAQAAFDVAEMVAEEARAARLLGQDVQLVVGVAPCVAWGDRKAAAAATRELLDNARCHARGAPVRVEVHSAGDLVRVRVEDGGRGVEATGDPFDLGRARRQFLATGHGLGLAMVAELARRGGGDARCVAATDLGGLSVEVTFGTRCPAGMEERPR
ncbi:MAG: hypothetical protein M0T80_12455 [Actinomycetota bacterium]|nr:hypothetical protein [Actinomycetota bacterium]